MILLTRDAFRRAVFERDKYRCVNCNRPAIDAHHIIERALWDDEGYYVDNGASLCEDCHKLAEKDILLPDDIRILAGINTIILPSNLDPAKQYTKWGKIAGAELNIQYIKYPSTPHLPWSGGLFDSDGSEDALMNDPGKYFGTKDIVVSEKEDGECFTIYRDGCHARSINSGRHPSRDWIKTLWANRLRYDIPVGWRVCGENLYAVHSIEYKDLPDYFLVFSIWNEKNICLSWEKTVEWCALLDLTPVPVLYSGPWIGRAGLTKIYNTYDPGHEVEGYVVRLAGEFPFRDFGKSVAKYVRPNHVQTDKHWMRQELRRNTLRSRNSNDS